MRLKRHRLFLDQLFKHGTVYFTVDDADIHRFRPIAGSISLVQTLIIALGYYRDAEKPSAGKARKPSRARFRRKA